MNTITKDSIFEYEIKKSKFITLLHKVKETDEVSNYLKNARTLYPNATHYCYAYIINENYHFSDDGEPGGTAGLPIVEVLKKKELTNVLCIVVRFFGGIKLGAGGLVRAYTKSVQDAIENNKIVRLIDGYLVELKIPYESSKKVDYLLKNNKIINKDFQEEISYTVEMPEKDLNIIEIYSPIIIKKIKIEEEF